MPEQEQQQETFSDQVRLIFMSLRDDYYILTNIELPMRLQYAKEQGDYALACDHEAAQHYQIKETGVAASLWRVQCYLKGFAKGLFIKDVPADYIDRWFS